MDQGGIPLQQDVNKVQQILIVPSLLNTICQITGMGFAAIARVTQDNWIACSVQDNINFGLQPGDSLEVTSTICNEIRDSRELVVFDNADEDPIYRHHHTPLTYGIKSYISIPIYYNDGSFFGTLCAVDPEPKTINLPHIIELFRHFSELITFHFKALDDAKETTGKLVTEQIESEKLHQKLRLQDSEIKGNHMRSLNNKALLEGKDAEINSMNASIARLTNEITELAYISSHDLQEPLRKIQMFANLIWELEKDNLSERSLGFVQKIKNAAERLQSLVTDLLTYSVNSGGKNFSRITAMEVVVADALNDLKEELLLNNANVVVDCKCVVSVIPFQMRQVVYNLVSNSLKFSDPDRVPAIAISCDMGLGKEFDYTVLQQDKMYCRLSVADNGIGFDQQFSTKIFDIFERLESDIKLRSTGIGLAIVKKVVENHNGHLRATGKENEGATFEIFLPGIN